MDENAVIEAVCRHLEARGWAIGRRLRTTEHGTDVEAVHPVTGKRCLVEAKGGTSAREGSNRYGKPFNAGQIRVHVAVAVLTALQLRARHPDHDGVEVLIAVPDEPRHRAHLGLIAPALRASTVGVLYVAEGGAVVAA